MKKKQIPLNAYFGCPLSFNKAKNDSKSEKTFSSSILLLLKYKPVEENWIEKSLAAFNAIGGYSIIKIENMQLLFAVKFAQFREHIEGIKYFKEDWLSESTN